MKKYFIEVDRAEKNILKKIVILKTMLILKWLSKVT